MSRLSGRQESRDGLLSRFYLLVDAHCQDRFRRKSCELNSEFSEQAREGQYEQALEILRTGLAITAERRRRGLGETFAVRSPLLENAGPALAALFQDQGILELYRHPHLGVSSDAIVRIERDYALVAELRELVGSLGNTSLRQLKKLVLPVDRSRVWYFITWMEKNGELRVRKLLNGDNAITGGEAVPPKKDVVAFRGCDSLLTPSQKVNVTELITHGELAPPAEPPGDLLLSEAVSKPVGFLRNFRVSGSPLPYVSSMGTWLPHVPKRVGPRTFVTTVFRANPDGTRVESIELQQEARMVCLTEERSAYVVLDRFLTVVVYSYDGNELWRADLSAMPEFVHEYNVEQASRETGEMSPLPYYIGGIIVSMRRQDMTIAIMGKVFRFSFQGEPIWSVQLLTKCAIEANETGEHDEWVMQIQETIDSYIYETTGYEQIRPTVEEIDTDTVPSPETPTLLEEREPWIKAMDSHPDGSLVVGTMCGHVAAISKDGDVQSAWNVEGYVTQVHYSRDSIAAAAGACLYLLDASTGEVTVPRTLSWRSFFVRDYYIGVEGSQLEITDLTTGLSSTYEADKQIRAVYPAQGALFFETSEARYST